MQGKPQKEQAKRIYLPEGSENPTDDQYENLIWIKNGYVNFLSGKIVGEHASRALRILEDWLPLKEWYSRAFQWREVLNGAEEVIYLDQIISVRQIDKIQFGNSRLFARKLRLEFPADSGDRKA